MELDCFGLSGVSTLSAKVVQFSQNSVSSVFSDGSKFSGLTNALRNSPDYYMSVEPVRVIRFQDLPTNVQQRLASQGANRYGIYSIDNRRLLAARDAKTRINVTYVKPGDIPNVNLSSRFSTVNGGKRPKVRCR